MKLITFQTLEALKELINDKEYRYGSVNYIRSNGMRFNWIEDFYKKL